MIYNYRLSLLDPNTNNYDATKVRAGKTNMLLNLAGGGVCGVAAALLIPIGFPISLLGAD